MENHPINEADSINVEEFMDRVQGDKDLLFELLDIFMSDFPNKRRELEDGLKSGNFETVEHVAHFLKGSCGNISAGSLQSIFHELEKRGKAKNLDGLEGYLGDIDKKYHKLTEFVEELRTKLQ